jgi:hypothetical protein
MTPTNPTIARIDDFFIAPPPKRVNFDKNSQYYPSRKQKLQPFTSILTALSDAPAYKTRHSLYNSILQLKFKQITLRSWTHFSEKLEKKAKKHEKILD